MFCIRKLAKLWLWGNRRKLTLCFFLLTLYMLLSSTFLNYVRSDGTEIRNSDQLVGTFSNDSYLAAHYNPSMLINNKKCRIPKMELWNDQVRSIVNRETIGGCDDTSSLKNYLMRFVRPNVKNLISVKDQLVIINESALRSLGLTLADIECCYQIVERSEHDKDFYNKDQADNKYHYSSKCYPMSKETTPVAGFLKITCYRKPTLLSLKKEIHIDFHLVAIFPPADNLTSFGKKLTYWKEHKKPKHLTNVLIIGVDSTSRLNFHRMMPATMKVLEKDLNAVEMTGFTKVAKNTFPNVVSLLTSYTQYELAGVCHDLRDIPMNDCPFLWRNFSGTNFLTALIDNNPKISMFNMDKLGFLREPVEIYGRPWMLAAYDENKDNRCIGRRPTDQVVITYMKDLVVHAASKGVPYFFITWISDSNHDFMSAAKYLDDTMSDALLHMKTTGSLDNTVVIFLGDHGYSFLDIRRSLTGWYEEKLPGLWISLPVTLAKDKPSWKSALHHNSKQLTTAFNIFDTLREILNYNLQVTTNSTNDSSGGSRGGSLLEMLPERSCDEAGIPWLYCPCAAPSQYKGNHSVIVKAAHSVIQDINKGLTSVFCKRITEFKVTAIAVVPKFPQSPSIARGYQDSFSRQEADLFQRNSHLIIGFELFDGQFHLETFFEYKNGTNRFRAIHRLQTNPKRICRFAGGVNYCYCSIMTAI